MPYKREFLGERGTAAVEFEVTEHEAALNIVKGSQNHYDIWMYLDSEEDIKEGLEAATKLISMLQEFVGSVEGQLTINANKSKGKDD